MARARFLATWEHEMQERLRLPKGHLVLRVGPLYRRALGKLLQRVEAEQMKNVLSLADPVELLDLDVTIEVTFGRRSLKANNLMWWIYEYEAKQMNAGEEGHREQEVTPEDLYRQDMLEHGDVFVVTVAEEHVETVRDLGGMVKSIEEAGAGMVKVSLVKTSSKWDRERMHRHLKMLFNRIAYHGGPLDAEELSIWWKKWRQEIADKKIDLYGFMVTREEYRQENPRCEACGVFIGHGRGHIDEIRTRGASGATLDQKFNAADLLALCPPCHEGWEGAGVSKHGSGVETFARAHPQIKEKILSALRRAGPKIETRGEGNGERVSAEPATSVHDHP